MHSITTINEDSTIKYFDRLERIPLGFKVGDRLINRGTNV